MAIKLIDVYKLTNDPHVFSDDKALHMDDKFFIRTYGLQGDAYYPVIREETIRCLLERYIVYSKSDETKAALEAIKYELGLEI